MSDEKMFSFKTQGDIILGDLPVVSPAFTFPNPEMITPYRVDKRISAEEAMMQCAEVLAQRSTCIRNQVGVIVTDSYMLQILGIGYNGNAKGLANVCDQREPPCGCVHAELNALLKAPGATMDKHVFTTVAPCGPCAKAIINSGVSTVYFRKPYRTATGVGFLLQAKIIVIQLRPEGTPRVIKKVQQIENPNVDL